MNISAKGIPILCYHRVHADDDSTMPPVESGRYCGHVTTSVFRRQMKLLADRGVSIVTHERIMRWLYGEASLPEGPTAAIDFDDNRLNVFENAYPIMEDYGFRASIFVVSRLADRCLPSMQSPYAGMTWEHLGQLAESGWVIGAHTSSHLHLAQLYKGAYGVDGPERVWNELVECDKSIQKRLGIKPDHFAYPSGDWSEDVEALVIRRYRTARLWYGDDYLGTTSFRTHPYRLIGINVSMNMTEVMFKKLLDGMEQDSEHFIQTEQDG